MSNTNYCKDNNDCLKKYQHCLTLHARLTEYYHNTRNSDDVKDNNTNMIKKKLEILFPEQKELDLIKDKRLIIRNVESAKNYYSLKLKQLNSGEVTRTAEPCVTFCGDSSNSMYSMLRCISYKLCRKSPDGRKCRTIRMKPNSMYAEKSDEEDCTYKNNLTSEEKKIVSLFESQQRLHSRIEKLEKNILKEKDAIKNERLNQQIKKKLDEEKKKSVNALILMADKSIPLELLNIMKDLNEKKKVNVYDLKRKMSTEQLSEIANIVDERKQEMKDNRYKKILDILMEKYKEHEDAPEPELLIKKEEKKIGYLQIIIGLITSGFFSLPFVSSLFSRGNDMLSGFLSLLARIFSEQENGTFLFTSVLSLYMSGRSIARIIVESVNNLSNHDSIMMAIQLVAYMILLSGVNGLSDNIIRMLRIFFRKVFSVIQTTPRYLSQYGSILFDMLYLFIDRLGDTVSDFIDFSHELIEFVLDRGANLSIRVILSMLMFISAIIQRVPGVAIRFAKLLKSVLELFVLKIKSSANTVIRYGPTLLNVLKALARVFARVSKTAGNGALQFLDFILRVLRIVLPIMKNTSVAIASVIGGIISAASKIKVPGVKVLIAELEEYQEEVTIKLRCPTSHPRYCSEGRQQGYCVRYPDECNLSTEEFKLKEGSSGYYGGSKSTWRRKCRKDGKGDTCG